MTKEALEKEALEKYKTGSYPQFHPDHYAFIHGYLAGAEPREKRIAELEQKLEQTEKDLKDYCLTFPCERFDEDYSKPVFMELECFVSKTQDLVREKREELVATFKKYGITISALSVHGNCVHPNKEIAQSFEEDFKCACIKECFCTCSSTYRSTK